MTTKTDFFNKFDWCEVVKCYEPVFIAKHPMACKGISLVLMLGMFLAYSKNINVVSKYTVHITDDLSAADRKKVCDNFFLHPVGRIYRNKEQFGDLYEEMYVAYPKTKGGVE